MLTQISIRIASATNSPVCRHLDQFPIECSAEGRDDGGERQETPCTVQACQACLEPKHLEERQKGRESERDDGKERGEGEDREEKTDKEIQQCIDQTIYWIHRKKNMSALIEFTQLLKRKHRSTKPVLMFPHFYSH